MRSTKGLLLLGLIGAVALVPAGAQALDIAFDKSVAWFVAPLPNASYEGAPVTIDAEVEVHQGLDDAGISTIEVFVNGESIGSQDCVASCVFPNIELDQGVHEFQLTASNGYTTGVTVYVDEELPSGETGDDTGDTGGESGETGDDAGETSGGSGGTSGDSGETSGGSGGAGSSRGCSVEAGPPLWAAAGLGLLVLLPGFRRKS
ncbi:DNA polymerase III alpha subunit [Enhygromyxa salina]|uniref:DNA polymerase III alpha subunit n=1 Tax=Enhygromyxa salina TaxID=215803 RepID=A0A0C2D643_9BACT|nr:Ig-like domain-containing protein [Enhygromyxa salina]KIG17130.1 DNA polymerase III alpha subunit [Enhygromyxa salina]